jgi:hypothetical protein
MQTNYKITNITYVFLAVVISTVVIVYQPLNPLCYDVFGYYMYLPLKFKYHDLKVLDFSIITHILDTYHGSETFYQAVHWGNGNWIMRYPIGLAVLFSPFYFIADFITSYTSYPADGFSKPYQLCILYGSLLYALIGLYFVKKTLTKFFNDKTAALTLLCIGLGTNYFFHVSIHGQGAMSHNFVFVLYAIIIFFTIKWHESFKYKYIIYMGLAVGTIAICRPTEIISVLIPLLYGVTNKKTFFEKISLLYKYKNQLIIFSILVLSVGFIQFGYWHYVSGEFIINPYGAGNPGEGLELLQPHILKVLFSFRKGWFIYTPLMLFTVLGFWQMYKNNKALFTPVFIYFVINLYIISSWSCWWYGACFGVRSLVPSYAALCLPLGYFVYYILNSKLKPLYLGFIICCIALNLFQSWQMSMGIMDSTNMSRAYYFSTFLQTTRPTEEQTKLLLKGKFNDGIEIFTKEDSLTHSLNYAVFNNFETQRENINLKYLTDTIKHYGKCSLATNPDNQFTPTLEIEIEDFTKKSYTWVKATCWLYSKYPVEELNGGLVIELKHNGYTFKCRSNSIKTSNFKPNVWNKSVFYLLTPDDLRSKKDLIRAFFWNNGQHEIFVDDLTMESYEPIIDKSVF